MHGLCSTLCKLQFSPTDTKEIVKLLGPAIEIHEASPFVRRLRNWPRSYPGDFETVELLATGKPGISPGEFGYWIEWYALNTAIAQQHRNKISWQYLEMNSGGPKRILSIGCGGGADFNVSLASFKDYQIVLVDMDEAALDLASARLAPYAIVDTIMGDAVRGLKKALDLGPFDLIVCGGLFDYLSNEAIGFVLRSVSAYGLRSSGRLIFTNISESNPYRVWMELIANWRLRHRTQDELFKLVHAAGFAEQNLSIVRDPTGLTYLACASA
jgi:2-polyprenyl-3-methyl-5-hydroxy-6-metoxy-1,4-benzoquinol methylase